MIKNPSLKVIKTNLKLEKKYNLIIFSQHELEYKYFEST